MIISSLYSSKKMVTMKNEYEVVLSVNHRVSEITVMFNYYYNNIYAFVLLLGVFSLKNSMHYAYGLPYFLPAKQFCA